MDDVERANEISDNFLLLLVNLKEQVNEALIDIADIKLSLKSVQESTQRFDGILFHPQAKGARGEKFVADQLALLPQGWVRQLVGVVAVLGLFLSSFR